MLVSLVALTMGIVTVRADNTAASFPFSQNWTSTGLITANDDWSGVASIIGYRGDGLTAATGVNPQTVLAGNDPGVVDVIANQTATGLTTGGVAEFDGIANSTIALQGSGTARAPYIKIFLDTTNANQIQISYNVRDIDSSTDNAVQQVALQYRVGTSGNFTNIPGGYIADATTGPSLATLVTPVSVTLPAAVNQQSHVELRIITTDAAGFDEWVGIDDISITANYAPTGYTLSPTSVLENQPSGSTVGMLTATDANAGDTHTFALVSSSSCAGNGVENVNFSITGNTLQTAVSFDYETKPGYTVCVQVTDNNGLSYTAEQTVTIGNIVDETSPIVLNTTPANNAVLLAGPTQIQVEFSEDVKNDRGSGAANNTANYLLVGEGTNAVFDTKSCLGGRISDDVLIAINSAVYDNNSGDGPYVATLNINRAKPLTPGDYRLFVCGTTSIEDLANNKLNNGASDTRIDFTVSQVLAGSNASLPATGFPMGRMTAIPSQPADKTYASYSDLRLEIPKLTVSTSIVGVPLSKEGWDVTWLGRDAGWLNGTAFPTWTGNSVITGHVWDAYNQPGIFYDLKKLGYGDLIKVHAFGQVYKYEVRQSNRIAPNAISAALQHEEKAWLTLITCEDYKVLFKMYNYRRIVRAVLMDIQTEK